MTLLGGWAGLNVYRVKLADDEDANEREIHAMRARDAAELFIEEQWVSDDGKDIDVMVKDNDEWRRYHVTVEFDPAFYATEDET